MLDAAVERDDDMYYLLHRAPDTRGSTVYLLFPPDAAGDTSEPKRFRVTVEELDPGGAS